MKNRLSSSRRRFTPLGLSLAAFMLATGSLCGQVPAGKDPFVDSNRNATTPRPAAAEPKPAAKDAGPDAQVVNIIVQAEFIRVPEDAVSALILDPALDPRNGSAVRKAVQQLVQAEKAEVLETAIIRTDPGRRAKVVSVTEVTYATEYDPPEQASPFGINRRSPEGADGKSGIAGMRPAVPLIVAGKPYWPPCSVPHPTAFETRYAGTVLEVDPTLENGDTIVLNIAPEVVTYLGQDSISESKTTAGTTATTSMPRFSTMRVVTGTRIKPGEYVWLGTGAYVSRGEDGDDADAVKSKVMMFARASVVKAASAKAGNRPAENRQVVGVVEFIEVPHEELTDLLQNHAFQFDSTGLRHEIQEMVGEKKANILETATFITDSSQRTKVEMIEELIYPTEYDPAEPPLYWVPVRQEGRDTVRNWSPATFPTPTAFETRNIGTTVEADPVVSPAGDIIAVALAPEMVQHVGDNVLQSLVTPSGTVPLVKTPLFTRVSLSSSVRVANGGSAFLGAVASTDENGERKSGRVVLIFLSTRS